MTRPSPRLVFYTYVVLLLLFLAAMAGVVGFAVEVGKRVYGYQNAEALESRQRTELRE